jgi:hypothetical protein
VVELLGTFRVPDVRGEVPNCAASGTRFWLFERRAIGLGVRSSAKDAGFLELVGEPDGEFALSLWNDCLRGALLSPWPPWPEGGSSNAILASIGDSSARRSSLVDIIKGNFDGMAFGGPPSIFCLMSFAISVFKCGSDGGISS